jgi:hypothetical protein
MKRWIVVVLAGVLLVVIALVTSHKFDDTRERREKARQAFQMMQQEIAEKDKLASLGDIRIDLVGLTLGTLNERLQQQPHKLKSMPNNTRLGWACGGDLCAVEADFDVPQKENVPPPTVPMLLRVTRVGFGKPFLGSIDEIHLGDPVDKVLESSRQRGNRPLSQNSRIPWNKEWDVAGQMKVSTDSAV